MVIKDGILKRIEEQDIIDGVVTIPDNVTTIDSSATMEDAGLKLSLDDDNERNKKQD